MACTICEVTFGLRCTAVRRAHYLRLIEEHVDGDVDIFGVEKSPDMSTLTRRRCHLVRGEGGGKTLRNQGDVERLGTAQTFGAHIGALMRGGRYDEALNDLDRHLAPRARCGRATVAFGALRRIGEFESQRLVAANRRCFLFILDYGPVLPRRRRTDRRP